MSLQTLIDNEEPSAKLRDAARTELSKKPDRQFVAAFLEQSKIQCRMRLQRALPWKRRLLTRAGPSTSANAD